MSKKGEKKEFIFIELNEHWSEEYQKKNCVFDHNH